MNFLIQTIDGRVKHDFTFTLLDSIEYHNWKKNYMTYDFINYYDFGISPMSMTSNTPVGKIDFVLSYLLKYYGLIPVPQNIPIELMKEEWAGRHVFYGTEKDIIGKKFVKCRDKFKGFTEICDTAPEGRYQISDVIDIQSEWRTFVFEGKMVGLQNYGGKFDLFPDVYRIKSMIKAFENAPVAYTLDVGITDKNETVVIEVHDFFSCGLYGFDDHRYLPYMFHRWFHDFVKR
jgi:hypothetical protein